MNENDIIAEYIKAKHPELLNSAEFVFFKVWYGIKNVFESFTETISKIEIDNFIQACQEFNKKMEETHGKESLKESEEVNHE